MLSRQDSFNNYGIIFLALTLMITVYLSLDITSTGHFDRL